MGEPFLNSLNAINEEPMFFDPTMREFDVLPSDSLSEIAGAFPHGNSSGLDFKDHFLTQTLQSDQVGSVSVPESSKENIKPSVIHASDQQAVMLDPITDLPLAVPKSEVAGTNVVAKTDADPQSTDGHGSVYVQNHPGTENVVGAPADQSVEHEGCSSHALVPEVPCAVEPQPQGELDIVINNVVCSYSTKCHINLRRLATEGSNVIYKRENGMVNMKIRRPYSTATIWASGKITVTGATSEEHSHLAAKRFARILQMMGYRTRFCNFRVVNVLATCSLPFAIRITHFSRDHPDNASYEPEIHPGVTYKIKDPKATLKIFSTGSITVTAPRVANVQSAVEHIFPLVWDYRMEKREVVKHDRNVTLSYLNQDSHSNTMGIDPQSFRYKRQKCSNINNDSDSSDSSDDDFSDDSD